MAACLALAGCGSTSNSAQSGDSGSGGGSSTGKATDLGVELPKEIADRGHFNIGMQCDSPPAEYYNTSHKLVGYEVAIASKLAEYAFGDPDAKQITCVTTANRIQYLTGGKVDFLLSTMGISTERMQEIDFTNPYWSAHMSLLVPSNSGISSYSDLKGKTVITTTGIFYIAWWKKCMPDVHLSFVADTASGITALKQGRGAAFAYTFQFNSLFAAKNPAFKTVGGLTAPSFQGMGVRKDDDALKEWLNAAIEKLRKQDVIYKSFVKAVDNPSLSSQYAHLAPRPDHKLKLDLNAATNCQIIQP